MLVVPCRAVEGKNKSKIELPPLAFSNLALQFTLHAWVCLYPSLTPAPRPLSVTQRQDGPGSEALCGLSPPKQLFVLCWNPESKHANARPMPPKVLFLDPRQWAAKRQDAIEKANKYVWGLVRWVVVVWTSHSYYAGLSVTLAQNTLVWRE